MTGSRPAVLAAAGVCALLLALAPWTSLWDPGEPRYAQATVEMLASGQYLYPTFNGYIRQDKPILFHWLMLAPVRLLGASELAARIWSPVALAVAALLTWQIGRRLLSPRAGLWALGILAAAPLPFLAGMTATPDALLLAAVTGALAAFAAALERGPRVAHLLAMTAALALAQLAGGLMGWAVPLLAVGGCLVWLHWREGAPARTVLAYLALAGFAAVISAAAVLAWALPAHQAAFGELARRNLGAEAVERPLAGLDAASPVLYLAVVLLGFVPWALYLPGAARAVMDGQTGGPRLRALLVGWVGTVLPVVLVRGMERPPALLLVWPALALAVAGFLEAKRPRALLAGTMAALALLAAVALPALDRGKAVPALACALRERTPESAPLATFGLAAPSLVFYSGRAPVAALPSERAVAVWSQAGGEGVLVIPRAALERVVRSQGPLPLREIDSRRGRELPWGERRELVALGRNL